MDRGQETRVERRDDYRNYDRDETSLEWTGFFEGDWKGSESFRDGRD